jgi:hypothetical protein
MTTRIFAYALLTPLALSVISSAWGWEPREPEGATPLNAEQIKATFAGQVFSGQNIDYIDQYFKDGRFKGTFHAEHYTGKWWVKEKDDYLSEQVFGKNHCYNIARGKDGNFCVYLWGSDRPDVCGTLEPIKGSD